MDMHMCRKAFSPAAWYCFHWQGIKMPGKWALSDRGLCQACEEANPPYEEAPSFMQGDED